MRASIVKVVVAAISVAQIGIPHALSQQQSVKKPIECAMVRASATNLLEKLKLPQLSPQFIASIERFSGANNSCAGPRELQPANYLDAALWSLLITITKGTSGDLSSFNLTLPLLESGKVLPLGESTAVPLSNEQFSKASFDNSALSNWFMQYEFYLVLRRNGWTNQQILNAHIDVRSQAVDGYDPDRYVTLLTATLELNKADPANRALRNCFAHRIQYEISSDSHLRELASKYEKAKTSAERSQLVAAMKQYSANIPSRAVCTFPDGRSLKYR